MKKLLSKINIQSTVVAFCILMVCIGTQQIQTVKWNTGKIEFFRDALGVWMAMILFTHYKWSDFVKYKIPYIVWSVVGGIGVVVGTPIAVSMRHEYLLADTIVIALGIFLMGYCVIHTGISFWMEKKRPKLYKPLLLIWVVMLLWMIFSKTEYLWPECYFVLFGCYYLTPQTKEQRNNVMQGIVNGMILGFLAIQGHSFLFRPYDVVRYKGNFCNPNQNCAFLCFCLVAILAKILLLTLNKREGLAAWLYRVMFYFMAGVCCSFIAMTVGRSGYLTTAMVTVFFLLAYCWVGHKVLFVRMGVILVLIFVMMLPTTYMAVRYIPTIHPHVLFYYQEGYSESQVHSYDPRDSEKYISFEKMLTEVLGRFLSIFYEYENLDLESTSSPVMLDELQMVSIESKVPQDLLQYVDPITGEINENRIPVLTYEEAGNGLVVRYNIYKWFWEHLSLRGMPYDEQGFQLRPGYWVQHAHSIYLSYGINFGYPVMILFTVFLWWGMGRLLVKGRKNVDVTKLACLMFIAVPAFFGLFEFIWETGTVATVVFYFAFREIFVDPEEQEA